MFKKDVDVCCRGSVCEGCDAFFPEVQERMNRWIVTCKWNKICEHLDKRDLNDLFPCEVGDEVVFPNGRTGWVSELRITEHGTRLVISKERGLYTYAVEYPESSIGEAFKFVPEDSDL